MTTNGDHPINVVLDRSTIPYKGLTKREYFAGLVLQGLLASGEDTDVIEASVMAADKLIEELNK